MKEPTFSEYCRTSVDNLRAALLDLYRLVGADPSRPQDVSRQYKLNRNLTWKVSRLIAASDPLQAVPVIPGPGGLEILLKAMGSAGAPAEALDRARKAAEGFERMTEIHVGDRSTLELMIDSMDTKSPMEAGRKLAYRGNTAIWGIGAEVRVTTQFLAPNRENPTMLDVGMIGGLTHIRRMRPIQGWPVFQVRRYNDDGSEQLAGHREAFETPGEHASQAGAPWLLHEFCTGEVPQFHLRKLDDATVYEIGDGPVGRTGEFSCFFGFVEVARLPRYRDAPNTVGELISSISAPVKAMQFDLFIHEDLAEATRPSVEMIGIIGGTINSAGATRLPLAESFRDLGTGTMVDTPLVDRYGDLIAMAFDGRNWKRDEFRCLRLVIKHPPMSSRIVARYTLPEAPSA